MLLLELPLSIAPLRSEAGYSTPTDVRLDVIADPTAVTMLTSRSRMVMIMETIRAEGYPGTGRYFPRI